MTASFNASAKGERQIEKGASDETREGPDSEP